MQERQVFVARTGKGVVHIGKAPRFLIARLEQRKIDHPQKVQFVFRYYAQVARQPEPHRPERLARRSARACDDQQQVALGGGVFEERRHLTLS